jgi:hypothetical protein
MLYYAIYDIIIICNDDLNKLYIEISFIINFNELIYSLR